MIENTPEKIKVVYSYAHEDEDHKDHLIRHLRMFERNGLISSWHDRKMTAGTEFDKEILEKFNEADIMLLLISSYFIDSDYCYDIEMKRALQRHEQGEVRVIPVILDVCAWTDSPLGKITALPEDAEPILTWESESKAYKNVYDELKRVIEEIKAEKRQKKSSKSDTKKISTNKIGITVSLPSPIVKFVPRSDEKGADIIEKINRLIEESEARTVVLCGLGGVGKTTLAAKFARDAENQKRVIWVDGESRSDLSLGVLLDEIAAQLDFEEMRELETSVKREKIRQLLKENPTLIIFTSYESLNRKNQSECLSFLRAPAFETLITSHERVSGIRSVILSKMTVDEAKLFLKRLIEEFYIKDFFTEENIEKIMKTAERNPLVMQWICSQIDQAMLPEEVFEDLEQGIGSAAEQVFNRSYNLPQLGDGGRKVLLALSLFPQDASRNAVKSIVGFNDQPEEFNQALKSLVNLRLINLTDNNRRISLRGLTQKLAKAHLNKSTDSKVYKQKFVEYFMSFIDLHNTQEIRDLDLLEEEKINLIATANLATELKIWETLFSFGAKLLFFLDLRGHWEDAVRINIDLLKLARDFDEKGSSRIDFANSLARLYFRRGQLEESESLYKETSEYAEKLKDKWGIAVSELGLGDIETQRGELEKGEYHYNNSLKIYKELDSALGIANVFLSLGILASSKGELSRAEKYYYESLKIYDKEKDYLSVGACWENLGNLISSKGDLEKAEGFYNKSLEINEKLKHQPSIATSLNNLAVLASSKKDYKTAEDLYNKSIKINELLKNKSSIASSLHGLGEVYLSKHDLDTAEEYCRKSFEIFERLNHSEGINLCKRLFGEIYLEKGDLEASEKMFKESLNVFQKQGYRYQCALTLEEYAKLAKSKDDMESTRSALKEAAGIYADLGLHKKAEKIQSRLQDAGK